MSQLDRFTTGNIVTDRLKMSNVVWERAKVARLRADDDVVRLHLHPRQVFHVVEVLLVPQTSQTNDKFFSTQMKIKPSGVNVSNGNCDIFPSHVPFIRSLIDVPRRVHQDAQIILQELQKKSAFLSIFIFNCR